MPGKKPPVSIEPFLENLAHPDYKVRCDAVRQLAHSRNPDATDYLLQALHDKTIAVKRLAIRGLGKLKDPRAIQPLIAMMDNPAYHVYRPAYEEVIRFGKNAVPFLIQALQHQSECIRVSAAYCLGEIGDHAATLSLIESLHDPAGAVAISAAHALLLLNDERAREPLADLLQNEQELLSPALNTRIALALGFLGDPRAIPSLEAAYDRQTGNIVWITAALGHIQNPQVISVLQKIRGSSSEIVRGCAENALQQLGFLDNPLSPSDSEP